MRTIRPVLIVALLAVVVGPLVFAQTARATEAGRVMRIFGAVEIERGTGAVPLNNGAPVQTGDRIHTSADGYVEIELQGGARLLLGPDSELLIPEQAASAIAVVDLLFGIVRATLLEEAKVGSFILRGRTAVASVRTDERSEWIVKTDEDSTGVYAIDGAVQVLGTGGSVTLEPSQGTGTPVGAPPSAPTEWDYERRNDVLARTTFP